MNCDIVRDLMPGYIDGVISETGSSAVREHLEDCGECRRIFTEMKEEMAERSTPEEQAALDGFKKIRSRTLYLRAAAALVDCCWQRLSSASFSRFMSWEACWSRGQCGLPVPSTMRRRTASR